MEHRVRLLGASIVLFTALLAPGIASATSLDGATPPLPASPAPVSLTEGAEAVYQVGLLAGETLALTLTPDAAQPATLDFDLYLYGPSATVTNHAAYVASAKLPASGYPERISYQAPATGTYYVEIFDFEASGQGQLQWQIIPEPLLPVYRFYNNRTGTHFYTPSADEVASVQAKWPTIFTYEGVAYSTKASRNTQPLYRFYNKANGSHFYTASSAEKDAVIARWSGTYVYEGETYKVSPANDGTKAPVYRFYNRRNGGHFYTASWDEAVIVSSRWSSTYLFEGPVFYLGQ